MFFKTCASSEAGRKYQVMKDPKELQALFKENKVDLSKPFIAMCGTGMYPLNIMLNFACRVVLLFFSKYFFRNGISVRQFGSRSGPRFCRVLFGSKLFAKVIGVI